MPIVRRLFAREPMSSRTSQAIWVQKQEEVLVEGLRIDDFGA